MKNYKVIYFLLAIVTMFTLSSCGDFLNIEPKDRVSEDNFWNEETDIEQMVMGTYVKLQSQDIIQRCIMWGETRGDNIGGGNNYTTNLDVYNTLRENLTPTNGYTVWTSFYSVINQCNTIIERSYEVHEKAPSYTYSEMLATQAEMAFLRDLCYFYLVRAFRDVPYYTNAVQSDDQVQSIAPTDGDQIVRSLITDLESVVSNAMKAYPADRGSSQYKSDYNRATQTSIYALLADLCLWDGQYRKCVEYSDSVIVAKRRLYDERSSEGDVSDLYQYRWSQDDASRVYPLIPTLRTIADKAGDSFNAIFGSGNSFESVFELAYTPTSATDNTEKNWAVGSLYGNFYRSDGNDGKGLLAASDEVAPDLVNSVNKVFDHDYDARFYENLRGENDYAQAYSAKFVYKGVSIDQQSPSGSGASALHFKLSSYSYLMDYSNANWLFYRLTDVMLMQAEALIEMASNDDYATTDVEGNVTYDEDLKRAFGLIYCVNRRSILAPPATTTTYALSIDNYDTRAKLRELCMKERRRELMFEGKRFFDIIRYCRRVNALTYAPSKSEAARIANFEALYWPYNKNEVKVNALLDQKSYYANSSDDEQYDKTN